MGVQATDFPCYNDLHFHPFPLLSMAFMHKKGSNCSTGCMVTKWILCVLLLLTAIAAIIGVYETHVVIGTDPARFALQFGSTSGSLAIIAFAISATLWMKQLVCCMSKCEVCK